MRLKYTHIITEYKNLNEKWGQPLTIQTSWERAQNKFHSKGYNGCL